MAVSRQFSLLYGSGTQAGRYDIFKPSAPNDSNPIIINLHGGGWYTGTRELNRNQCAAFARRGWTALTADYRLVPETNLEGQVHDIFELLKTIDAARVFFTGDSAGAQLALLTAAVLGSPALQEMMHLSPLKTEVSAVALSSAVCFFKPLASDPQFKKVLQILLDCGSAGYCEPDTFPEDTVLPPVLLVTASDDEFYYQSERTESTLSRRGVRCEMQCFEPSDRPLGHVFNVKSPMSPAGHRANDMILDFFGRNIYAT